MSCEKGRSVLMIISTVPTVLEAYTYIIVFVYTTYSFVEEAPHMPARNDWSRLDTHTHQHTQMHTHTRTHIHTQTHTHTHTPKFVCVHALHKGTLLPYNAQSSIVALHCARAYSGHCHEGCCPPFHCCTFFPPYMSQCDGFSMPKYSNIPTVVEAYYT